MLSLSFTGIRVSTWLGTRNNWAHPLFSAPSAMANSSSNEKVFGSLAVTAFGDAFAVVEGQDGQADRIEQWQVADGAVSWRSVGFLDAW